MVVCPSMLVLVPCTQSSAVPCHHKEFPTISTRRKLRMQSYSLPEGGAPTPSHRWSHLSQLWEVLFYSSVLLLVRPTYWGGMEVCHCGNPRMLCLSQNCSHFLLFDFLFYYSVCTHSSPLSPAWKTTHLESKHDLNSCATLDIYVSPLSLYSSFHTVGMMI